MTENQNKKESAREPGEEGKKASAASRPGTRKAGSGRGATSTLSVLAFLLSLALVAGAAWYWDQLEDRLERLEAMEDRLQDQGSAIERLDGELAGLSELPDRTEALDREMAELETAQGRLEDDMARLDERTESLREFIDAGRSAWRVAEVEHLLQLANRELQLAGRVETAMAALDAADERLQALGDPAFTPVREAIASDRERLRGVEAPDVTGLALTLGSLIDRIDNLPLARGIQREAGEALEPTEEREESLLTRLQERTTRVLRELISVRHEDAAVKPLLAPEQEYFLRRNLALSLASARLALLEEQPEVWDDSLGEARDWLESYFDMEADNVQAMDEELARLMDSRIRSERPDISSSLDRLRRVQEARD